MGTGISKARSALSVAAFALVAVPAAHSHDNPSTGERLGEVNFKIECTAEAQKQFNVAMAYFHSFAWSYINDPLERTLKADPSCGMAHWARALALLNNPFGWPTNVPPKALVDGSAALDAARATGLKSARERDYVEALAVFYRDPDKLNHRTRAKALEAEFEKVAARYPDDREATILYALVLSANFEPTDKQYTNQLRAARLLEPIFAEMPKHPGVAHYLIHSYDYPPIAHHGLDAARRYGKIAPDAPHALHMPSHIFTRLGAWTDSVESNRAAARSDAQKGWNSMHAYDYMVYAHLQMNQDRRRAAGDDRGAGPAEQGRSCGVGVLVRRDAGAARARTRCLGRRGEARAVAERRQRLSVEEVPVRGSGQRLRARHRGGPDKRQRGGHDRGQAPATAA